MQLPPSVLYLCCFVPCKGLSNYQPKHRSYLPISGDFSQAYLSLISPFFPLISHGLIRILSFDPRGSMVETFSTLKCKDVDYNFRKDGYIYKVPRHIQLVATCHWASSAVTFLISSSWVFLTRFIHLQF